MTTNAGTPQAIAAAIAGNDIPVPNAQGLIIKRPTRSTKKIKIKMNLYGKSGVGKTRLALQIAKHFKTFLIFSEKSETSIVNHPDFDQIEKNLEFVEVDSWNGVKGAFDYVTENQNNYEWIIVDSLTDINKRVIEDVTESSKEETMSMRQWGQVTNRMERFIRYIRDLKTNIAFICLSTGDKNEMTGEITQYPSLTGRLKEEFPAYLDINGYMYTLEDKTNPGQTQRAIQFTSSPKAIAKDRFDKLQYEYADMTAIFKKLGILD
jgi:phage nucleotide-binding protein